MITQENQDVKKLAKLIDGIHIAMMTTIDTDGQLRSRPMATQQMEFDGQLWFFTGKSSHKVVEINGEHRVNIAYADPSSSRYVSISGSARLVSDRAKSEELWNPVLRAWFPRGLEDPDIALLNVTPEKAEYWDTPGSHIGQTIAFVKSIFTGQQAKVGDHGQLSLHST